ncbi:FAD-dependent oxidoreductase [Actinomadura formosensis]|uniref:FAD-dependent oxidoreductase n=1 Tax=Actinomadura formosensis TaxID=60706 RepID=UPI0008300E99|nr:FAD-dependent oxidoreductase [Actinomadura formosensis]
MTHRPRPAASVLIVGAGPVGLTLAHELARRGVAVRLVDKAGGPSATSRAVATHARTLEIYDQMGVVGEMLARGRHMQAFSMHRKGRRLARMGPEYSELPTRYPHTLLLEQATTEEVLRAALREHGVEVEWGVELESFEQDGARVTGVLRTADGDEAFEAPWLVGCDGGHSTVRKRLGLRLLGDSTETWLIADAMIDMDVPQDSIHWLHTEGGTVMAVPFPRPGKWRLLDTVDVDYRGNDDEVAERFTRKLAKGFGVPVRDLRPLWVSVFTIQQRMIERMRVGRCLVAGDAAHVHSPASGQGMNTGIQDAVNLAWKLAMVVQGDAVDALLDTYGLERVPVGEVLLGATRKATALVALKSAVSAAMLPVVFAVVRNVPALRHRIERKIIAGMSALALAYPDSPLTRGAGPDAPAPRPGERVARTTREAAGASPGWSALVEELRDPRWTLLIFPGADGGVDAGALKEHGWLSVRIAGADLPDPDRRLRRDLNVGAAGWLLIRPDGYLSAQGADVAPDALARAVSFTWLRAQPVTETA